MIPERKYLTTKEAAAYCSFETVWGLHSAHRAGKVQPAGRRGGGGTMMWEVAELDRFLRGGSSSSEYSATPMAEGPPELPRERFGARPSRAAATAAQAAQAEASARYLRDLAKHGRAAVIGTPEYEARKKKGGSMSAKKSTCPKCGAAGVPILYGEPDDDAFAAAKRGELAIGGCIIETDAKGRATNPAYRCKKCRREFGRVEGFDSKVAKK